LSLLITPRVKPKIAAKRKKERLKQKENTMGTSRRSSGIESWTTEKDIVLLNAM
jgi:hypothetical protein